MTCRFVLRFATSHITEEQACRYAEMRIKWSNFLYYLHWIVLLKAEAEGFPTLWRRQCGRVAACPGSGGGGDGGGGGGGAGPRRPPAPAAAAVATSARACIRGMRHESLQSKPNRVWRVECETNSAQGLNTAPHRPLAPWHASGPE